MINPVTIRDSRGREIGYVCNRCGRTVSSMWGNICNICREDDRKHNELMKALRNNKQ